MQLEHDVGKKKAKGEAKAGDAGGEAEEIKGDGKGGVQAVCFNESGDWLISVLRDNVHTLTIWEWRTHTKLYQQDMMQARNSCAQFFGAILPTRRLSSGLPLVAQGAGRRRELGAQPRVGHGLCQLVARRGRAEARGARGRAAAAAQDRRRDRRLGELTRRVNTNSLV